MEKYIVRVIDENSNTVSFYGTNHTELSFPCNKETLKSEETHDLLKSFCDTNGYTSLGRAQNNEHFQFLMYPHSWKNSTQCIDENHGRTVERVLTNTLNLTSYEQRKAALLDARSFFRAIEKEVSLTIDVPVNCTSKTDVLTPKTKIIVDDERTLVTDASYYRPSPASTRSLHVRDFSHMYNSELFSDCNREICLLLRDFADKWSDTKHAIEEQLQRDQEFLEYEAD